MILSPPTYSYEREVAYYRERLSVSQAAHGYDHLEARLRWLVDDPHGVFSHRRVLDLGAGACLYSRLLAERYRGVRVAAMDLFLPHLEDARSRGTPERLTFVAGDCFHLPFRSASVDIVFCNLLICQLRDLEAVAREIHRVLVRGGRFLAIEPNAWNVLHLARFWFGVHSPNLYLLRRKHLDPFVRAGFELDVSYFYPKWRTTNRLLSSSMAIRGQRLR